MTKKAAHNPLRILVAIIVVICSAVLNIAYTVYAQTRQTPHKTTEEQYGRPAPTRPIRPEIPSANRNQQDKVFLEYADVLSADEQYSDRQLLRGNVKFRKSGMYMYCDSAYFYPQTNSLDAFGNVRMEQGDTIFVFADILYYDGASQLARLRTDGYRKVEMQQISRPTKTKKILTTDSLNYDLAFEEASYFNGGQILNHNLTTLENDTLTSLNGIYRLQTKDAEVFNHVWLRNKDSDLRTNRLLYNTDTRRATIVEFTEIKSGADSIVTTSGWYSTDSGDAELHNRSVVIHRDEKNNATTLEGDSIVYDKLHKISHVYQYRDNSKRPHPMILTDTANHSILIGGYGYYNDSTKEAFATEYPLMMEFSRPDTIFMRADTIRAFMLEDSTRVATAYHRARFYRVDIQGVSDSLVFMERDSILRMYDRPIVWSGKRQVSGNHIDIHFNDSTVDWAELPDFGIMAEAVEEEFYNQLAGKVMKAYFKNQQLSHLDASGNVQAIVLPMENDSTYNKLVNAESSFLSIDLTDQKIDKLKMWSEVTSNAIPIFLLKSNQYYLPDFKWYEAIRPKRSDDLGDVSDELEKYFTEPVDATSGRRRRNR